MSSHIRKVQACVVETNPNTSDSSSQPTSAGNGVWDASQEWRFGLRWDPSNDILQVPDVGGVYVLFFIDSRRVVGIAYNLFRQLRQSYFAPGRKFHAFSWKEISYQNDPEPFQQRLNRMSYEQLWAWDGD